MVDYRLVWKTSEVVVELHCRGSEVILERTRGRQQKKKRVYLKTEYLVSLLQAVVCALSQQPQHQLRVVELVGLVDGGMGVLSVKWSPYWFGTCNALMIQGRAGQCIAIEQWNAVSFAAWLALAAAAVHSPEGSLWHHGGQLS